MKSATVLIAVLLAAAGANAATTVLYETDWEAAPASPAWVVGPVAPRNGWINQNNTTGHQVVANGSQGPVVTPYGTQFHKFTASENTSTNFDRLAWVDITTAFASRPAGQNLLKASFDVYVPGSQASVPALYGVTAYHGLDLCWGVLVDPSDRSVNVIADGDSSYTTNAFAYDTWFKLTVNANYTTGEISTEVNGVNLPELTLTSVDIFAGALTDVDLFAENYVPTAPVTRISYSDNFRVTAEGAPEPRPTLNITPGASAKWHLSWSAAFSNWILESTHNIESPAWTKEVVTPTISGGVASVDLPEAATPTFYRLRQP